MRSLWKVMTGSALVAGGLLYGVSLAGSNSVAPAPNGIEFPADYKTGG